MSHKLATVISLLLGGFFLCGFAGSTQGTEETTGTPWWVWLLIILVLAFAVLLWWLWWRRREDEKDMPTVEPKRVAPVEAPEVKMPEVQMPEVQPPEMQMPEVVPSESDDLEIIEGIGPKIAGLLKAAGITTFAQMADADLARVQEILSAAKLRLADPTTWAEQARLAANGDWPALETLQNQLKGGRRA